MSINSMRTLPSSMLLDTLDSDTSPTYTAQDLDMQTTSEDQLQVMEDRGKMIWNQISQVEQFTEKYGRDLDNPSAVHCYLFTRQTRIDTFKFEAFASVKTMSLMKEELVFHPMFEKLITRYTRTRAKPNPVLIETRSTEFCYRLTILVEAVPQNGRFLRPDLRLAREFSVLHHVWERFRDELGANVSPPDQLMGIPMPFEFVNVMGHRDYDFGNIHGMSHRGLHGEEIPLNKLEVPGSSSIIGSTLNYMSVEKLGPTLHYLTELLKAQRKIMNLSTALKIFDQLLCRLMVLHKYGVIVGNLDTKHLHFGVREASNVLYISRFDSAVVTPTKYRYELAPYSERCAALSTLRRREAHFVHDIESAFYIFLSLIFPVLPWDDTKSSIDSTSTNSRPTTHGSSRSTGADEKANFWSSNAWFNRMMRHVNFEFADPVYQGLTVDLLTMMYNRTQDALVQCESISHADYMALLLAQSSSANNAYSSLRRIIAIYFRFESLSSITRDPICQKKVELLMVEDPEDRRVLWNLNDWCWNVYYPGYVSKTRTKTLSMIL